MIRKQTIITTAIKLFARQGFDGTTTLQIATDAGVTEPLIYYHFKGKDDLFTHILGEAFGAYFACLEALEDPTEKPVREDRASLRPAFSVYRGHA